MTLFKALDDTDSLTFEELSRSGLEFFGLDMRRYAAAPARLRLRRSGVSVLSWVSDGETIGFAGYRINTANHQQAEISACTYAPHDLEPLLDALIGTLCSVRRADSFVTALRAGSPDRQAYVNRGFEHIGTLRSALYRDYVYHDCEMFHFSPERPEEVADGLAPRTARARYFEASSRE